MCKFLISLFFGAIIAVGTTAFLHTSVSALRKSQGNDYVKTNVGFSFVSSDTSLSLSPSPDGGNYDSVVFPKSRTDVRIFLTQRSIQSFVFLLNQCREEHTVRWLEKFLDFSSVDNFHGTGAFNLTKFPEWDSIFLDCVDRPEEVVVIQIRERRRQRKLSGHNAYFESLKSSTGVRKANAEGDTKSQTHKKAFSTARNYLDSMKSIRPPSSGTTSPQSCNITSEKLSGTSNYLDNLSLTQSLPKSLTLPKTIKPTESNKNGQAFKDNDKKREPSVVNEAEKLEEKNVKGSTETPKQKSVQRRTFAPGKSISYLENLSTMPNPHSSEGDSKGIGDRKVKQSTETSNNPFLDERTTEVQLSIDPPALVRRILSVREQLSKEWVEDLDLLSTLNDEIVDHFEEFNNKVTTKDEEENDDDEASNLKISNTENVVEDKTDDKCSNDLDLLLKALIDSHEKDPPHAFSSSSPNITLQTNVKQSDPAERKHDAVFDRSIFDTWSQLLWNPNQSSSPYRKANFDLLLLLATQESIHRILTSYKSDGTIRRETQEWFLDFYSDNVNKYFDGHQTYARSEDFLAQMLKSPRTLIETNSNILAWVDPAVVAEDIVRGRSDVILEWIGVAETILDEHTDLRRLLFTNMISKSIPDQSLSDTILSAVKKEAKKDSVTSDRTEIFGAFE